LLDSGAQARIIKEKEMVQGSFPARLAWHKRVSFLQAGKIAALTFATIQFLCFIAVPARGQVSVLTQNADTERDAVYSNETQLTPTSVIHKLFTMSLDNSVNGQALILGGLNISGEPANILLAATASGGGAMSAWAFNADTGAKLWQLSLGTSASFSTASPVVDPSLGPHGALFVLTKDSATNTNELHAIDVIAGTELPGSPVTITATMTGDTFDSAQENGRTGLLDINGTIYTAFCHMTDAGTYHGWVAGYQYNGSTFTQNGVWCDTCAGGNEGGIWQGGDGLIYDGTSVFVATGNGTIGSGNYGMSIVQLSPSALGTVESSFLPPNAQGNSNGDADLNGGGMVLMPGTGGKIFIGPTKYNALILVDSTHLANAALDTYSTNGGIGKSPTAWNSGTAQYAYVWPDGNPVLQFCYSSSSGSFTGTGACEQSSFTSSGGGTLAISSTPSATNAILWAYGNGELHAMNPANVSAADYWNSNESSGDSTGSGPGGFQYLSVANGKVYVPSGKTIIAYGTPSASCTSAPSAPSGLTATATSTSNINLTWSASTVGSGCGLTYSVFQSTTPGFTPSSSNQIASGLTTLSFSATGLAASTTYYFLVEGVDSIGASTPSNQASATTQSGVIGTQLIAINSGGALVSPFVADEDFTGGGTIDHANTINTSEATDPAPAAVYQTGRDGNFSYTIGGFTAGTDYLVRLHFCETFFSSAGSRTFNVSINGTQVLTDFDIFAAAGGQNIANIQAFTEPANPSGQFVIVFTSVVNNSLVSGIEIDSTSSSCTAAPSAPTGLTATDVSSSQINLSWTASTAGSGCSITYSAFRSTTSGFTPSAGNQIAAGVTGTTYSDTGLVASTTYYYLVEAVDSAGSSATASNQASAATSASSGSCTSICINAGGPLVSPFVADEDFTGGGTIDHANTINTSKVTNPAPAAVYQSGRDGNFTYTIGGFTANSSHTVRLHFCETYWTAAGKRTFNVSINSTSVLTDFDIFATAGGQNIANIQQFTENANSSGQYVIVFTSVINNSLVSGIEID
jgi:Malectin domain/Fibronectin type III domain